jgi:hypothetical protein
MLGSYVYSMEDRNSNVLKEVDLCE